MMRRVLAGCFLAGALISSAFAAEPLTLFLDRANGFAVAYPAWIFPLDADNPEGTLSLTSADGKASLQVSVTQGKPLAEMMADIRAAFAAKHRIAFNKEEPSAITLSGSAEDGRIGYLDAVRLSNTECRECVVSLQLTFPKKIRPAILREISRMTKTLRATADPDFGLAAAKALAAANPDIARWMQRASRNRATPVLDTAETTPDPAAPCVYSLHAYELTREDSGALKSASFGYYDADVCTQTIKRQPLE